MKPTRLLRTPRVIWKFIQSTVSDLSALMMTEPPREPDPYSATRSVKSTRKRSARMRSRYWNPY